MVEDKVSSNSLNGPTQALTPCLFHIFTNLDSSIQHSTITIERDTAISCVRTVFPDADITANCVDVYPVKVIIEANAGGTTIKVWEGRQQDLFRKYASKRKKAQEIIIQNLQELKEDFE